MLPPVCLKLEIDKWPILTYCTFNDLIFIHMDMRQMNRLSVYMFCMYIYSICTIFRIKMMGSFMSSGEGGGLYKCFLLPTPFPTQQIVLFMRIC